MFLVGQVPIFWTLRGGLKFLSAKFLSSGAFRYLGKTQARRISLFSNQPPDEPTNLLLESRKVYLLLRGLPRRPRPGLRGLLLGKARDHARPRQGLGLLQHRRPRMVVGDPATMTVCCMVPPSARVTVCMAWARSGGVALVFVVVHVDQLCGILPQLKRDSKIAKNNLGKGRIRVDSQVKSDAAESVDVVARISKLKKDGPPFEEYLFPPFPSPPPPTSAELLVQQRRGRG